MKRVKAACICQTLHFMLKEDVVHCYAVKLVNEEVARYKASLDNNMTKFKIVSEETQPDARVTSVKHQKSHSYAVCWV